MTKTQRPTAKIKKSRRPPPRKKTEWPPLPASTRLYNQTKEEASTKNPHPREKRKSRDTAYEGGEGGCSRKGNNKSEKVDTQVKKESRREKEDQNEGGVGK